MIKKIPIFLSVFIFFHHYLAGMVSAQAGAQIDVTVRKIYTDNNGQTILQKPIPNATISWYRVYLSHDGKVSWGPGEDFVTNENGFSSKTVNACGGKFQLQLIPESISDLEPGGRWETSINKFRDAQSNGIRYAGFIDANTYHDINQEPGLWVFQPENRARAMALVLNNPVTNFTSELKGALFLQYSNAGGAAEVVYTYYPPNSYECSCDHMEILNGVIGPGNTFTARAWVTAINPETSRAKSIHFYFYRRDDGGDILINDEEVPAVYDLPTGKYYADWPVTIPAGESGVYNYYIDAGKIICAGKINAENRSEGQKIAFENKNYLTGVSIRWFRSFFERLLALNKDKNQPFVGQLQSDSDTQVYAPTEAYSLQLGSFYPVSDIKLGCSSIEFIIAIQ